MTRRENNPELKSINLSLKLLTGAAVTPSPYFQRSTSTLQQLSNRLKMANQGYNYGRTEHDAAKEWYAKHGINLSGVLQIAKQAKKQQRVKQTSKEKTSSWEQIEYEGFDNLIIEEFLHQNQEKVALFAVMSSFAANTTNNHLKNLRASYINSLSNIENKSENGTTKGGSTEAIAVQVVSEFVVNYQNALNQYGPFNISIHRVVGQSLSMNKYTWLSILYQQIEMVQHLGRAQPDKRNYIMIITLKQLQKISSNASLGSTNSDKQLWRSVYDQYRKGKIADDHTTRGSDNQLLNNLTVMQDQINRFQEIQIESFTDININDTNFLKRLKSIVLGKMAEGLFEQQLIDETWFLIIAFGLKRRDRKQEWNLFKKQVKSFLRRTAKLKIENRAVFDQWIASRISLGAFHQLVDEYKQFNESNRLNNYNKTIVMEVFVVLAFNPELIEEFSNRPDLNKLSRQTRSVIQQIVIEIAHFAESLRRANQDYTIFITLLASILAKLDTFKNFEQLPERISKALRININDLSHKNCEFLSDISQDSSLTKKLLGIVLLNAKIQSNQDYLTLADLCKRFSLQEKIEPIFFKCVILHQIDHQSAISSQSYSSFGSSKLFAMENQQTFKQVMEYLTDIATKKNRHVLHFLTSLIQLKELVKMRKVDELSAKKKGFETHMEDQTLLSLLGELSDSEGARLTDIYVDYYEQLRVMYKLIYLSKNNTIHLRKRYAQLGSQLDSLQKRQPILRSQRLGKLIAELCQ